MEFGNLSHLIWTLVLAVLLFWPVRQLVFVLSVRRAQSRAGGELPDEAERGLLRRKANFTSGLLCFVFAFFYVGTMFRG